METAPDKQLQHALIEEHSGSVCSVDSMMGALEIYNHSSGEEDGVEETTPDDLATGEHNDSASTASSSDFRESTQKPGKSEPKIERWHLNTSNKKKSKKKGAKWIERDWIADLSEDEDDVMQELEEEDVVEEVLLSDGVNEENIHGKVEEAITVYRRSKGKEREEKKKQNNPAVSFGDATKVIEIYTSNWSDSTLDVFAFFLCVAAFQEPIIEKLKEEEPHWESTDLQLAYHYLTFASAGYKGSKERVMKYLRLDSHEFIEGEWQPEVLIGCPAYFIAVDKINSRVILSIRGTKDRSDILVDLAAQYTPYRNGLIHVGFYKTYRVFEPIIEPKVKSAMDSHPGYSLIITGHSMGAAISSILALEWREKHPEWNLYCWAYATPCVFSSKLIPGTREYITTFIHNHDLVPRLSVGALDDLENMCRLFTKDAAGGNIVAIFQATRKLGLRCQCKKQVKLALEVFDQVTSRSRDTDERQSHLYPPGKIVQLWRETTSKTGSKRYHKWHGTAPPTETYSTMIISKTMLGDHKSGAYLRSLESLMAAATFRRDFWLSMSMDCREKISKVCTEWDKLEDSQKSRSILEQLTKNSKYRQKATEAGLIRPFLLLVSLAPGPRCFCAYIVGICISKSKSFGNVHAEAYKILTKRSKGIQSRVNATHENVIVAGCNWYQVLYRVAKMILKLCGKHAPKWMSSELKALKNSSRESLVCSNHPSSKPLLSLESLFSMIQIQAEGSYEETLQTCKIVHHARMVEPTYSNIYNRLKRCGYSEDLTVIFAVSAHQAKTGNINDLIRQREENIKKKGRKKQWVMTGAGAGLIGVAGLAAVGSVPTMGMTLPIAVAAGAAGTALLVKSGTMSARIGIVGSATVQILNQRCNLALAGIDIADFYGPNFKPK